METTSLGKIIAFLSSVPPNSHLRLMLQLALAASIPDEQREKLLSPLTDEKDLVELIEDKLLFNLMNADGELDEAEENMLLEAMENVGLVVPSNLSGAEVLLEELSEKLIDELEEFKDSGTIQGEKLLWN